MIPDVFVPLAELPLNPNGKLDRARLPAVEERPLTPPVAGCPPRNPVEEALGGIWAELLKLDRVSVTDNFFELGGHSLLATQVMSRVRVAFHVEIPLATLFERPTIEEMAEVINRSMLSPGDPDGTLEAVDL
jgi:acyl carrier protein